MFSVQLVSGPRIEVVGRHHAIAYATDGSLPNPLEATYAALAGCAGVYAKKACRELGVDDAGIGIELKVVAQPDRPLLPTRIVTTLEFPERFTDEQRQAIRASIDKCAVKALMQRGDRIEFAVT
ncbi:MAG TPA: OsmC family protein [Steroidobacteraceae bacterium]|nr:OsmC family protein [Steroidobacteraceae bacterium]